MSSLIIIEDSTPSIIMQEVGGVRIDEQASALVINYQVLKGDKGDDGTDADVEAHLQMFDHGELHEHSNKGVLDLISYSSPQLLYNGQALLIQSYEDRLDSLDTLVSGLLEAVTSLIVRVYLLENPPPPDSPQ